MSRGWLGTFFARNKRKKIYTTIPPPIRTVASCRRHFQANIPTGSTTARPKNVFFSAEKYRSTRPRGGRCRLCQPTFYSKNTCFERPGSGKKKKSSWYIFFLLRTNAAFNKVTRVTIPFFVFLMPYTSVRLAVQWGHPLPKSVAPRVARVVSGGTISCDARMTSAPFLLPTPLFCYLFFFQSPQTLLKACFFLFFLFFPHPSLESCVNIFLPQPYE